jgi:hypothetical protein
MRFRKIRDIKEVPDSRGLIARHEIRSAIASRRRRGAVDGGAARCNAISIGVWTVKKIFATPGGKARANLFTRSHSAESVLSDSPKAAVVMVARARRRTLPERRSGC